MEQEWLPWLTYWVVFGVLHVLETMGTSLLGWTTRNGLPYYHQAKLVLLVWCFLPGTHAATHLYRWFVRPLFRDHEHHLDTGIDHVRRVSTKLASEAARNVTNAVLRSINDDPATAAAIASSATAAVAAAGHRAASPPRTK
jgi:hypothetical protein